MAAAIDELRLYGEERQTCTHLVQSVAKEMWVQRGKPSGADFLIWLEAERFVIQHYFDTRPSSHRK